MLDFPGLRSETRYGMPAADQIVINRHYTIGYSYYFRQAKWALEIVDPDKTDAQKKILETYMICGPIFNFDVPVVTINPKGENGNTLPIPHAYFKSVLTEDDRGKLHMWSFLMKNEGSKEPLESFLVPTRKVERYSGLLLWEVLVGREIDKEKSNVRPMWKM